MRSGHRRPACSSNHTPAWPGTSTWKVRCLGRDRAKAVWLFRDLLDLAKRLTSSVLVSPSLRQTYRRIRFEPVKESDAALSNCDDESVSCRGRRVKVEGEKIASKEILLRDQMRVKFFR